MRMLFLALLILNLAYFGWHYYAPPEPPPEPARIVAGIPPLELLKEPAEEQQQAAIPESDTDDPVPDEAPPAPERICYTLGPYKDADKAEAVEQAISEAGYAVSSRSIEQREVSGYWVYLPPQASRKEALALARKLAKKGVKDYYVVPDGENANAVSLGLFSEAPRAERRTQRIAALGYQAQTAVRYRTRTLHWLDYDEWQGEPLPAGIWRAEQEGETVQRIMRECI